MIIRFLTRLLLQLPVYKYRIQGVSMAPAFQDGESILVNRMGFLFRKPQIGEVVAVKDPRDGKILIKRITEIKNNQYFVTGDNKDHSTDSRKFGMIGKSNIVGKVL